MNEVSEVAEGWRWWKHDRVALGYARVNREKVEAVAILFLSHLLFEVVKLPPRNEGW